MTTARRIAIDVMGGEVGPSLTIPAALAVLARHPGLSLSLVGDQSAIAPYLETLSNEQQSRVTVIHAETCIDDDAKPESVLRNEKTSSIYKAVDLVRQNLVEACVSAGNTGALLMAGRHLLKTIPGIDKPAIIASIPVPASGGRCYLLDVGANVNCDAEQLCQFGVMGAVLASSLDGKQRPKVGLLNIGTEHNKGAVHIREAARLLTQADNLEYCGFIEGNRVFAGDVDVIVCDGFTGNVTIKSSAGAVDVMEQILSRKMASGLRYKLSAYLAKPLLQSVRRELNPSQYNGASLLGLQGIIVKSHGNADLEGFACAVEQAIKEVDDDVPGIIASKIGSLFTE